jgi:hypothetical protein
MFTVLWADAALNELANLWVQADSSLRKAITAATNQIDKRLQKDPHNEGESRGGQARVLFEFPLGTKFEADQAQSVVRVLHVWTYKRRS